MTVMAFIQLMMVPTMATMFVSGVWHGAGYTFLIFGLMHGLYISINHAWRQIRPRIWPGSKDHERALRFAGWLLTFLSVAFAIVMFRAPTVTGAVSIWSDMIGR